ncbi:MAG: dTMP kinase [Candidatus Methylomirabilis oxyfera]|nr:dTMP kinase [Candidatus Methylomirabilis oxyfera]
MTGLFITFEGGEGSGKTTHLKSLAHYLRDLGDEVVETRDPGGTTIGKEIRTLLLSPESAATSDSAELLLYEASRAQLVREVITPAITRGAVVLCDRFTDSTLAYQGFGRGLDQDLIRQLNHFVTGGLGPDLTILLDLHPRVGLERCTRSIRAGRAFRDRIAAEPLAFHQKIREGYLTLAREEPDRFRVIDASLSVAQIEAAIKDEVLHLKRSRFTVHS